MKIKKLLGERVIIIPDDSDEEITAGGIILPPKVHDPKENLKSGIIAKKGQGVPWNKMEDIHLKQRVYYKRGSGKKYEEEHNGHIAKYLILAYQELLFNK